MGSSASLYFEIPKFFVFSVFGKFSGSAEEKDLAYKVVPVKRDEGNVLTLSIWSGINCIDKSEDVKTTEYPLTQEGYDSMLAALEGEYLSRPDVPSRVSVRRERARQLAADDLNMGGQHTAPQQ